MMRTIGIVGLAYLVAGCATTAVTPVSQNQFILSTSAAPACGTAGAQQVAAKMAAVETLRRGYDRYVIGGAQNQNNVRAIPIAPTNSYTTAQASSFGNTAYGSSTTTYAGGGVMYSGTNDASLLVVMLRPGDPNYDNAVDARAALGPKWEKMVKDGIRTC